MIRDVDGHYATGEKSPGRRPKLSFLTHAISRDTCQALAVRMLSAYSAPRTSGVMDIKSDCML